MTLSELQRAGAEWRKKPDFEGNAENWDMWMIKSRLRTAVEIANAKGLSMETLAKELVDELK